MKPQLANLFRTATALISITSAAQAQTAVDWNGSTSSDWNTGTNWNGGTVPTKIPGNQHARINTHTGNIATISASISSPVDIFVGDGAATNGRLDHTAGVASTGGGNWMFVGRNGGNGVYNLANTAGSGGTFTNYATGDGSMFVVGGEANLFIGGQSGAGSTGTVNVNTLGGLTVINQIQIGTNTSTGTLNIDAGSVTSQNWTEIGNGAGSTGNLNMSGGSLIKTGVNNLIIGANGSTGNANITGGRLESNNQLWIANNAGSIANASLSGTGTIVSGNAMAIGRNNLNVGNPAIIGTLTMTGGTLSKNGANHFCIGGSGDGTAAPGRGRFVQSDGAVNVNGEFWVGNNQDSVGEYNLSGGTVTNNSWVAIARNGGSGTVNMTGGTWNKTGDSNFIIGASGAGKTGAMNMSGGTVTVAPSGVANRGITWIGEVNGVTGILNLSGSAVFSTARMTLGEQGGATGNANLNGGTLNVGQITGGAGNANLTFNGTQVIATANQAAFLTNLDAATVGNGGFLIDTQAFAVATAQPLTAAGTGGLVKSGTGSLAITGANTYSGPTRIDAGSITLTTASTGGGAITLADDTSLTLNVPLLDQQLATSALTLGNTTGARLGINLQDPFDVTTAAPILVGGNLEINGPAPLDVSIAAPQVAQYPLIRHTSRSGSGSLVLGALSRGLQGTLVNVANGVDLAITRAANLAWDGTDADPTWNTTSSNWFNLFDNSPGIYLDLDPVTFDDLAENTDVILNTTVTPSIVDFVNAAFPYTLTGTGKISGTTGLNKLGTGLVTIGTANDFTGATTLTGGILSVATLPDGGVASPIGASSADPANLRFNGGQLLFTGPNATTDRGFSITGLNSSIHTDTDLTFTGRIVGTAGQISKLGTGTLTIAHSGTDPNTFGGTGNPALRIDNGTLTFDGSSGDQLNTVTGEIWVGSTFDAGGHLSFKNSTTNVTSWLALSRINGPGDHLSTVTLDNAVLTTANMSTGYSAGNTDNVSRTIITLNDSAWTNNGVNRFGETVGNTTNVTLNGNSVFSTNNLILIGEAAGTNVAVTLNDTSVYTQSAGGFAIGFSGTGSLTLNDDSIFNKTYGELGIGDLPGSSGTLSLSGNATVNAANTLLGRNTSEALGDAVGTVNQSSGSFHSNGDFLFQVGVNGSGTWNLSGGTVTSGGWVALGRFAPGEGVLNVSGGSFSQTDPARAILIGEDGTGTLNLSGSGAVNVASTAYGLIVGWTATGNGTVNLNGGTLTTTRIQKGTGYGEIHFDGGLLRAGETSNPTFLNGLNLATVKAGGAHIDSNSQAITIGQILEPGTTPGGGLTKSGSGTLTLTAPNSYTGPTTVTGGTLVIDGDQSLATGLTTVADTATLGGSGVVGGNVINNGTIAPGGPTGTLSVNGNVTLASGSSLAIGIDESQTPIHDTLAVTGTLTIASGTSLNLDLTGAATQLPLTIATASGGISGTFTNVTPGATVVYNANSIVLTAIAPTQSPAESWIAGFFPGETNPAIIGLDADPDGDGVSNLLEFALNGNPNDPANNGTVVVTTANSSAPGDALDLVITLAVRKAAPAFDGTPAPTSSVDGITYAIQGSINLSDAFSSAVSAVDPITTGLPTLPPTSDYGYRSFRLDASHGLTTRGFLRVQVTTP